MGWLETMFAKLALKKAIKQLLNYLNSDNMKSKKTTIAGIIGGLSIILTQVWYALDADPATVMSFEAIIAAFGVLGIGWFARDNDVTSEKAGAK